MPDRSALSDHPVPKPGDDAATHADAQMPRLLAIMARLRTPGVGCPWDLEQDFASIAPYTIEEAYEVADAIARGHMSDLRDELGDLLLQVVFHARMAEEAGLFAFADVAHGIAEKLLARHPHVFGPQAGDGGARSEPEASKIWEARKEAERWARAAAEGRPPSVLDGVTLGLPALLRAVKLQKRAARVGFDWDSAAQVMDKVAEELAELRAEVVAGDLARETDEFGDLLFALVNWARHRGIDPEAALRATNAKFERRFRAVEGALAAEGRAPGEATLAEMEALWVAAKLAERA